MISAFDVIGPAMIGPSSSHTAGAVRIGLVARHLLGGAPVRARIGLHGSFAATGAGHATDRALVGGLLGFSPDDERLENSRELAEGAGLSFELSARNLGEEVHPNSACLLLEDSAGETVRVTGSSIGGGSIQIVEVDGFATSFNGALETLALWHEDRPGYLAKVTTLLSVVEANIATIRTSRQIRGEGALSIIEVDTPLPGDCLGLLTRISVTRKLRQVSRLP